MIVRTFCFFALWVLAAAAAAYAQETRGTISGTVLDEQGTSVPGATITVLNVDTNVSSVLTSNSSGYYEASLLKVISTEFQTRFLNEALQALGTAGLIKRGSPGERLHGDIERLLKSSLVLLFGGGSNDVQRDIIATHGLGLAR